MDKNRRYDLFVYPDEGMDGDILIWECGKIEDEWIALPNLVNVTFFEAITRLTRLKKDISYMIRIVKETQDKLLK